MVGKTLTTSTVIAAKRRQPSFRDLAPHKPQGGQAMARQKLSRNAPCPCGSGRKYKVCCLRKGIEFTEDDAGTVRQSIPMTDDVAEVMRDQRQKFIDRFGREPGPDDPIFFDLPHPEHVEHLMVEDMKAAGIDPAIIFAFERTGRLVTADNQHLIPEKDLAAWDAAIREYEEKHRGEP